MDKKVQKELDQLVEVLDKKIDKGRKPYNYMQIFISPKVLINFLT